MQDKTPFSSLRIDPKKSSEGVWITHPESGDKLRCRRLWCPEYIRAYAQARTDYEAKNGEGSADSKEGQDHCEAVAMATGLVVEWVLKDNPERPYDSAAMTAVLIDAGFADLRNWILSATARRDKFRPDVIAGNS